MEGVRRRRARDCVGLGGGGGRYKLFLVFYGTAWKTMGITLAAKRREKRKEICNVFFILFQFFLLSFPVLLSHALLVPFPHSSPPPQPPNPSLPLYLPLFPAFQPVEKLVG